MMRKRREQSVFFLLTVQRYASTEELDGRVLACAFYDHRRERVGGLIVDSKRGVKPADPGCPPALCVAVLLGSVT